MILVIKFTCYYHLLIKLLTGFPAESPFSRSIAANSFSNGAAGPIGKICTPSRDDPVNKIYLQLILLENDKK